MTTVALLGGSFNPPHVGHLMVCSWVIATEQADEVWLLPCREHAFGKELLGFSDRAAMCEVLTDLLPKGRSRVCGVEGEREGPSRTYDTVAQLQARHEDTRFSLVVGADILAEIDGWHRSAELLQRVGLIVVGRPGFDAPKEVVSFAEVSSSDIRARLEAGVDVSTLVPHGVLRYIKSHGFFASPGG